MSALPYPHGTRTGYVKYRCTCDPCREAHRIYQRDLIRRLSARGLDAGDPRHGSLNGYNSYGCRCQPCTEAKQAFNAAYALRRAKP